MSSDFDHTLDREACHIPGKRFPVLLSGLSRSDREKVAHCPRWVRWELVKEHEDQVKFNHYQTIEKLAERGGLSPRELLAVLKDMDYRHEQFRGMTALKAVDELVWFLASHPA